MSTGLANQSKEAVFLCYHSVAVAGMPYLVISPATFEGQLAQLCRRGYRSGSLDDLRSLDRGERLLAPTVFLTFDDGYLDTAEMAMPLLSHYGFKPWIFILPDLVDAGGGFEWPEVAEAHADHPEILRSMTWPQVELLAADGAEIGSHTLTHPHLPTLDTDELTVELASARQKIEQRLGSCETLAYPYGEWDAEVERAARDAGYKFAFTLPRGPETGNGPLSIPRINVDNRDRGARFALKLMPLGRRVLLSGTGARGRRVRNFLLARRH